MVIVFGYFLIGHACQLGQLGKLRGCEHPFGSDAALAVEQFEHFLNYVHVLHVFTLHINDLLVRVKVLPNLHLFQLVNLAIHKIQRILNHNALHILIDRTDLLDLLGTAGQHCLMLDVKTRVIVGL
jgi:hypothetical protein